VALAIALFCGFTDSVEEVKIMINLNIKSIVSVVAPFVWFHGGENHQVIMWLKKE